MASECMLFRKNMSVLGPSNLAEKVSSRDHLGQNWKKCTEELSDFYPSFLSYYYQPCAPTVSLSLIRQLLQKSQALGRVDPIQHPVCHNTGMAQSGSCQLMAVDRLQNLANPVSAQARNLPANDGWTLWLTNSCQITGWAFSSHLTYK